MLIRKGYYVQIHKDAEHLTNPWGRDRVRTDKWWHSTTRTADRAGWYQITRPLTLKKAESIAKAYQREGCLVRIKERTNSGTRIVKVLPQRRNRKE